ncbi:MAG: hypothetical protein AB4042_17915, partial [Leptolyngbyaceae cyanobacterium]
MGQQNNFLGGFLLGTLLGGVVGGVAGVLVSSRLPDEADDLETDMVDDQEREDKWLSAEPNDVSRRNLEVNIAQLYNAFVDVRQQLCTVNVLSASSIGDLVLLLYLS